VTVHTPNISSSNISNDGIIAVGDCLKNKCSLQELDLSHNTMAIKGASVISEVIQVNKTLQKLDSSNCAIPNGGVVAISKSLKYNNSLKELNMSRNEISEVDKILEVLEVNKLDISCCGV